MAKATIVEADGTPLYRVRIDFDISFAENRINALNKLLPPIELELVTVDNEIAELKVKRSDAADDVDTAINEAAIAGTPVEAAVMAPLVKILADLNAEILAAQARRALTLMKKFTASRRITTLQNAIARYISTPEVLVWCADYTTSLTVDDEVALTLVPGENTGATLTIRPGYEGGATWSREKHGQLVPPFSMTPHAFFWNIAMLPGWQKWKPTYRHGTITSIIGDFCKVDLDEERSSAQRLPINYIEPGQTSALLSDVPINYMECNGEAFKVSDRVIVEFLNQDWRDPVVIGFIENPMECPGGIIAFPGSSASPSFGYFGLPPIPTTGSNSNQKYQLRILDGVSISYQLYAPGDYDFGNIDWQGDHGRLSFRGPQSRYWKGELQFSRLVYQGGAVLAQHPSRSIQGAAIVEDEAGERWLIVAAVESGVNSSIEATRLDDLTNWTVLLSFDSTDACCHFSASGKKFATVFVDNTITGSRKLIEGEISTSGGLSASYSESSATSTATTRNINVTRPSVIEDGFTQSATYNYSGEVTLAADFVGEQLVLLKASQVVTFSGSVSISTDIVEYPKIVNGADFSYSDFSYSAFETPAYAMTDALTQTEKIWISGSAETTIFDETNTITRNYSASPGAGDPGVVTGSAVVVANNPDVPFKSGGRNIVMGYSLSVNASNQYVPPTIKWADLRTGTFITEEHGFAQSSYSPPNNFGLPSGLLKSYSHYQNGNATSRTGKTQHAYNYIGVRTKAGLIASKYIESITDLDSDDPSGYNANGIEGNIASPPAVPILHRSYSATASDTVDIPPDQPDIDLMDLNFDHYNSPSAQAYDYATYPFIVAGDFYPDQYHFKVPHAGFEQFSNPALWNSKIGLVIAGSLSSNPPQWPFAHTDLSTAPKDVLVKFFSNNDYIEWDFFIAAATQLTQNRHVLSVRSGVTGYLNAGLNNNIFVGDPTDSFESDKSHSPCFFGLGIQ